MNKLLTKHLFTEHNTHFGGVAKFGYVHLELSHELYFVKEIKQRFRFFGLPLMVTTQLETVQVPLEIVSLMTYALEQTEFSTVDLVEYRGKIKNISMSMHEEMLENLFKIDGITEEQKNSIITSLQADKKHLEILLAEPTVKEKEQLSTFFKNGYIRLFKVGGTTSTHYMARILDDRISFYVVDLLSVKNNVILANVKSFYITRTFIEKFLNKINKKGVDIV